MMDGTRTPAGLGAYRVAKPGRSAIAYREFGERNGPVVLALHGTPGSREKFALIDAEARRAGLRVISPDRWGYGGTPLPAAPSLTAFAEIFAGFMTEIGIARYAVLGVSGGGPYAVALAARASPAVTALALVSPVAPLVDASGPVPGISPFHRLSFLLMPRVPGASRAVFTAFRAALAAAPALALGVAAFRGPASDRAIAAEPGNRTSQAANYRAGLAAGVAGAVLDMRLFSRPWGIEPAAIAAPSRLWIGSKDGNVPVRPAIALARAIPGCALDVMPEAGHCWLACHQGEVLGWIKSKSES